MNYQNKYGGKDRARPLTLEFKSRALTFDHKFMSFARSQSLDSFQYKLACYRREKCPAEEAYSIA